VYIGLPVRRTEAIAYQAARPADTDNNENRNTDFTEDADFADSIRVSSDPCKYMSRSFSVKGIRDRMEESVEKQDLDKPKVNEKCDL
jgi:hypothetical protein